MIFSNSQPFPFLFIGLLHTVYTLIWGGRSIFMQELVCGICGETITDPEGNCPYCGAEPNHFVPADTVDRELIRKIYEEGGAEY